MSTDRLEMTLRPMGTNEIEVRQVALGLTPMILIHFEEGESEGMTVRIDATGFETPSQLLEDVRVGRGRQSG